MARRFKSTSAGRRSLLVMISVATALCGVVGAAGTAAAQGGEAVQTTLRYDDEDGERVFVEGAEMTVTDSTGAEVGSATSDAEGRVRIEVPGPGTYTAALDEATLPEEVTIAPGAPTEVSTNVEAGSIGNVIFQLQFGEGTSGSDADEITLRRVLQLGVEGIKIGLFLALAAIGLSLIYGTTGLVNFAHGEMITFGMLAAYFFNFYGLAGIAGFLSGAPPVLGDGVNLVWATVIAVILGGVLGYLLDTLLFAPMRRRGISNVAALVFTIGLAIFMRYLYLFIFGGSPRFFRDFSAQRALDIGPVDITAKDLIAAGVSIAILVGVGLLLQGTRIGKAMRAVSDNRDLAASSGIDVQRVIRVVWVAGGALAALGGVFFGLSEQVRWDFGSSMLLLIFAGVTLGGLGTAYGALVGCLVIGLVIQWSTMFIPAELKNVSALVVLILILLVRPQGILGRAERVG
jgi:branched-chain amino acid transport system permease protein